jgi:lipoic acid synthetase
MFCAVKTDTKPPPPDPFEPFKVRRIHSNRLFVSRGANSNFF